MELQILKDSEVDLWNDFCAQASTFPILQTYEWGQLKSYFGWQPIYLVIKEADKIIGGALILKRKLPILNRSIFYMPRGPVIDFKNEEVFSFLIEGIKKEARKHKAVVLKADPEIDEKDLGAIVLFKKMGFSFIKKQIQPRATLLIDLKPSLDDILASFEEKTRYNIRLALKKGVEVRAVPTLEGVKIFYDIYKETAGRDNFLIHPYSYYEKMFELFVAKGTAAIFVAYYDHKPIAAIYNFCFGKKVWYMYGASSSANRNLMPNHALHFEFIKWAKELGYETYDLWGIPANPQPNHPLWGVYRFKKGFSSKLVKWIGACDLPLSPMYYQLFDKGLQFWQSLRSLIKKGKIVDSLAE